MTRILPLRLLCALALIILPSTLALARTLSGEVTYRERIALDPRARITVQLVDVSRADAPANVIAQQRIRSRGKQVPFAFKLTYRASKIRPGRRYELQARIERGPELLFINQTAIPVEPLKTRGPVTILVQQASARTGATPPPPSPAPVPNPAPTPAAALQGTEWLAEDIGGQGVLAIVQSTLAIEAGGKISGSGGCNRYFGTVTVKDGALKVGPLGATQMACVPAQMEQERKFLDALSATQGYRLDGAKLVLLDGRGQPLVRLVKNKA
ncbi:META domain-containing protein [Kaistia granuli]|uniref:META domain-containing protein n=1 Tax=Kaistia granuli TaxID=363259 RepID=UPI000361406E|nr:YbaY family lipoprotein [Kaistia granuli]